MRLNKMIGMMVDTIDINTTTAELIRANCQSNFMNLRSSIIFVGVMAFSDSNKIWFATLANATYPTTNTTIVVKAISKVCKPNITKKLDKQLKLCYKIFRTNERRLI